MDSNNSVRNHSALKEPLKSIFFSEGRIQCIKVLCLSEGILSRPFILLALEVKGFGGGLQDGTLYNSNFPQCIAASSLISEYIVGEQFGETAATSGMKCVVGTAGLFSAVDEEKGIFSSWIAGDERCPDVGNAILMH